MANLIKPGCLMSALLALAAVGCNQSPYELAPVRGAVTIDGQPFAEGKVMFAPIAKGENRKSGKPAFGRLQADGSFSLTTYEEDDGAVVGEHWVTLISLRPSGDELGKASAPASPGPASRAAPKFDRVSYPERVTVAADRENKIDVPFTRQQIAQYAELDD